RTVSRWRRVGGGVVASVLICWEAGPVCQGSAAASEEQGDVAARRAAVQWRGGRRGTCDAPDRLVADGGGPAAGPAAALVAARPRRTPARRGRPAPRRDPRHRGGPG